MIMQKIIEALTDNQISTVRVLFKEYEESIGIDLCFQGFEEELKGLPGKYAPPNGGLFIALIDEQPVGCIALRPLGTTNIAELKRLYVRSSARKLGVGLALAQRAINRAREAGYHLIRLDTLPTMQDAQRLYRQLGFKEITAYTFNPVAGVTYMELDLRLEAV